MTRTKFKALRAQAKADKFKALRAYKKEKGIVGRVDFNKFIKERYED